MTALSVERALTLGVILQRRDREAIAKAVTEYGEEAVLAAVTALEVRTIMAVEADHDGNWTEEMQAQLVHRLRDLRLIGPRQVIAYFWTGPKGLIRPSTSAATRTA